MKLVKFYIVLFFVQLVVSISWAQSNLNGFYAKQVSQKSTQSAQNSNISRVDGDSFITFLPLEILDSVKRVFDHNHQPALQFFLNIKGALQFEDFVRENSHFYLELNDSVIFNVKVPEKVFTGNFIISDSFTYRETEIWANQINQLLPKPIPQARKEKSRINDLLKETDSFFEYILHSKDASIDKWLEKDFTAIINYEVYTKDEFVKYYLENIYKNKGKLFAKGLTQVDSESIDSVHSLSILKLSNAITLSKFELSWVQVKGNWKLKSIKCRNL